MSSPTKSRPRFRVGDWVTLQYGLRKILAEVVEDRGPLNLHGLRSYRIRPNLGRDESEATEGHEFEAIEDDLEAAEPPESANPLLETALSYIRQGMPFAKIRPGPSTKSRQAVTFVFSDGTENSHEFKCDKAQFRQWWKRASAYLRSLADAIGTPEEG